MSTKTFGPGEPRVVSAEIEGDRLRGRVDGREVDVRIAQTPSSFRIENPGRPAASVVAVREGSVVWVQVGASVHRFEEVRATRKRTHAAGHDELIAPMPSKVVRIEVAPGATVAAGAPLLVLEAMKMEHTLRAPHAGIVSKILVATGEMVGTGQRLLELDAEPA